MAKAPRWIGAEEVRRLGPRRAVDALEAALRGGLDPAAGPARSVVDVGPAGELLLMPAAAAGVVAVKLATVAARGRPRVQGVVVVFDADTLAHVAVIDGIALTNLRTAAVSALAVRHLAAPGARRLLVYGTGPQAWAHVEALRVVAPVDEAAVVARDAARLDAFVARCRAAGLRARAGGAVAEADLVACCTTARAPLFDGDAVPDEATVVAIGSHEPGAREVDERLAARATVVVETRASALREAGDVVQALRAGALREDDLVELARLVRGAAAPRPGAPRLFKSTGMAWEDAVIAAALVGSARRRA